MNLIGRRIRAAVNPLSSAFSRWWCHSAVRHLLTGYGPTARGWQATHREIFRDAGFTPSAEQMKVRRAKIDELPGPDDRRNPEWADRFS